MSNKQIKKSRSTKTDTKKTTASKSTAKATRAAGRRRNSPRTALASATDRTERMGVPRRVRRTRACRRRGR